MHHFKQLIDEHGSFFQIVFFVFLFVISWNIETLAGVMVNYRRWQHAFLNAPFSVTNIPGQFLLGWALVKTIEWTTHHAFGFLRHLPVHSTFSLFLIAFVFLDFGEYVYHVIMHKVKRLWMFHLVHHSDRVVDASTTLREHPGENMIRLSFTLVWVFLCGCTLWMLILRQLIQTVTTLFAHLNYRLPDNIDKIIGWVFITPNLHQVHHHYKQPYTDCNYGDVLSVWDRIFGTFKRLPAAYLVFGIDTFMEEEETNSFPKLVKLPFKKYRKLRDDDMLLDGRVVV